VPKGSSGLIATLYDEKRRSGRHTKPCPVADALAGFDAEDGAALRLLLNRDRRLVGDMTISRIVRDDRVTGKYGRIFHVTDRAIRQHRSGACGCR
jgi:hypothetical protein